MRKLLICSVSVVFLLGLTHTASADLVGWWTFDEGSGSIAYDHSGNGNDGTLNGDPEWVVGYFGGALGFDGSDDYVDCEEDPSLDLTTWTITFWLKANENKNFSGFIIKGLDAAENYEVLAYGDGSFHLPITFTDGTRGHVNTPPGAIVVGEWAHFTYSYDSAEGRRFYKNGSLIFEDTESGTPQTSTEPLSIGNEQPLSRFVNGTMDDIRIYNHVLTEPEMAAAMEGSEGYPYALGPAPKDGSMAETTSVQLSWGAGAFAVSHDVYFGDSLEDVNQATPESDTFQGNQTVTEFPVQNLAPGATYYWRVDEVNDANAASPWKGDIWSFWVQPAGAWDPSPADGGKYVLTDQALTWKNGMGTLFHTVYFGENYDEVSEAVTGGWMIADALYDPGTLETDKTYFWRVDEFTMTGTVAGETWSFTTLPDIPVADDPNLTLWWTLAEGMGSTAVDWSGHGHHGSLRGDAQWIDGALTFDGKNDYVSALLDVSETEYAAAFWFKTTSANCGLMAVVQNDLGGGGNDRHIYLTGGDVGIRLYDNEIITTAGLNLANGGWHHVVYTYGASVGGQKLYVDGVLQASGTKDASDFDWQERINIGFSNDAAPPYFEGALQDVRIYDKTLSEEEVQQVMRGDPSLAWTPQPPRDATVDVRDATALRWSAGDTASSHDVYFGTDRVAVAAAGKDAAEFQGNQPGTSFSLAGLVEMGGGDYFWRIDEVEAGGTVQTGYLWKFTIPDYLIVDDFESYSNEVGSRVFETWIDGIGFTLPEPGHPGNSTGAAVGHDIWSIDSLHYEGTIMETANVHGGGQAMPIYYDNTFAPGPSEADRSFVPAQNWTVEGVTTLVVHFRGEADNTGQLYVEINGVKVPYDGDPADIASGEWIAWEIDLASVGVSLTNVTTLTIGIEGGQTGILYIDDIILTKL